MGKKVHIICGKCGSDEMNFVINEHCPDDPQNVASMSCSNCCELTGIAEWSEFNGRELKGEAVALSTPANVNALQDCFARRWTALSIASMAGTCH